MTAPSTTAKRLKQLLPTCPALGMVLGSGFQSVLADVEVEREVKYEKLPGFPKVGVRGHQGRVVLGQLRGTPVVVLCGRVHYYEGHPMETVTFPVRVLAELGVRDLLLTNAAGGISRRFKTGDFMLCSDHINLMGANPLRGLLAPDKSAFVDLTEAYDPQLRKMVKRAAKATKVRVHEGVYLAVSGPSYETPAEIRAFARLGADAVGMSTVPEAIVARQCGVAVAGLSCITNLAAGLGEGTLSHEDVLRQSELVQAGTRELLGKFAELHGQEQ